MDDQSEMEKYLHTPRAVYAQMWMVAHRKNHVKEVKSAALWCLLLFFLSAIHVFLEGVTWLLGIYVAICLYEAWKWQMRKEHLEMCDRKHGILMNAIAYHDGWKVFAGQEVLPPDEDMK